MISRTIPVVIPSSLVPSNGVHHPGSEISVTFNVDISCDRPYWFEVRATVNKTRTLAVGSELQVHCQDRTLYLEIGNDEVCPIEQSLSIMSQVLLGTAVDIEVLNFATSTNLASWSFVIAPETCPTALFSPSIASFVVAFDLHLISTFNLADLSRMSCS